MLFLLFLFLGGCICTQAFNSFTTSASQLGFLPPSGAHTWHVCMYPRYLVSYNDSSVRKDVTQVEGEARAES